MPEVSSLRKLASQQDYVNFSHSIISSRTNYLIQMDLRGKVTFVNQACRYAFGTEKEFEGQELKDILHPNDVVIGRQVLRQCMQNPLESISVELIKNKTGGDRTITRWEFVGVLDEEGKLTGIQGLGHDVSDKEDSINQAERINQLNQHLLTLSTKLMELRPDSLQSSIEEGLQVMTQFLEFEQGLLYLWEAGQEESRGQLIYEHLSSDVPPSGSTKGRLSIDSFSWSKEKILCDELLEICQGESQSSELSREVSLLNALDASSLLAVPISYQRHVSGYILFVSSTKREPQSAAILKTLKILGSIVGNAFHHIKLSKELSDSRSQYKLLADNIADMVSRHELDGVYSYVSPSCKSLLGYESDELVGSSALKWIHPEDQSKAKKHLLRTVEGKVELCQYRKLAKNGQYQWMEITAKLVEEGGRKEIVASTRSIHQQKLTEDANIRLLSKSQRLNKQLRESQQELELTLIHTQELNELLLRSEKKFRSLTEKSFDAITVCDTKGKITYASPSIVNVTGYTAEELVGTNASDYIFLEDLPLARKVLHDAIAQPKQRSRNFSRMVRKDGVIIWVESVMTNLLMDESIQGLVSNFRDVTEQRNNEEAIKEYSERLAIATESANIGIWDWLLPQDRIVWDERTIRMFGVDASQVTDYKEFWKKVIHPDDLLHLKQETDAALEGRRDYSVEYRIIRQDTEEIRHFKSHAKVTFSDGEPVRMTGVNLDITNLKDTESQLRKNLAALEKSQAELDQFVYSTSHNLRSPLASVLGLVSILGTTNNPDEREQYLQLIENSIHRLDETIQEIIEYFRNSRINVNSEPIDFQQIIADVLDSLYFLRNSSNIQIHLDIADDIDLLSDVSRIRTIFNNLLSNAIKYFNPYAEQPYVNISIQPHQQGVKIMVADNGMGIEKAVQDKVFDMFFRATSQDNGSGLGLYIVREATTVLGGSIYLASQRGEGTTFTIYIPSEKKD